MKQKNNITLLVIGVLTLLVAIVGAAYAYFSSSITPGSGLNLDVEAQANTAQFTASGGQFGFTVTGAEMQQANAGSIAKEATGSINVSLTSPKIAMCTFDVAFAWNSGSSYTATSGRGSQFEFGVLYEGNPYGAINNAIKPINFDTLISNGGKVLEDVKIIINEANGTSKTTNITLNFKVQMYNLNHDQSSLAGSSSKTYSGRFYVTNVECSENKLYLNDVILASNEIYPDNVASTYVTSSTGINFGNPSSDTNGKGVYYTNQNTENNDYTFYYRGDVQNNYVKFGREIIASCTYNGKDVMYQPDRTNSSLFFIPVASQSMCEQQGFCNNGGRYEVGYTMEECKMGTWIDAVPTWTEQISEDLIWKIVRINEDSSIRLVLSGDAGNSLNSSSGYLSSNGTDSADKTNIDNWYNINLKGLSSYIADSGFCEDNSTIAKEGGMAGTIYVSAASTRLSVDYQPQFKCTNPLTDLYTTSSNDYGNKLLKYPIALLTADEVAYSGYAFNTSGSDSYLNNTTTDLTMTLYKDPNSYSSNGGHFIVDGSNGKLYYNISSSGAIRPVINLRSDIKISGGTGTYASPYVLSLD